MRARVFLPMFLFAVSLPAWGGEDKAEDAIKMDLSYLEKTWGLKCKSHRITDNLGQKNVIFLLEFTKDVENLKELRAAFSVPALNPALVFYFFDEDNVLVHKSVIAMIQGEVTGKKGDAIRVSLRYRTASLTISIRLARSKPDQERRRKTRQRTRKRNDRDRLVSCGMQRTESPQDRRSRLKTAYGTAATRLDSETSKNPFRSDQQ